MYRNANHFSKRTIQKEMNYECIINKIQITNELFLKARISLVSKGRKVPFLPIRLTKPCLWF